MNYPTVDISTVEQKELLQNINVLQNVCGFELIEIEQASTEFKGCVGIQVPKIKSSTNNSDPENPSTDYKFMGEWEGGSLKFTTNPLPRVAKGTGKVAFLVRDDVSIVDIGALSGEPTGWNMEFLASMYGEKDNNGRRYFVVIDPRHDAEIRARYARIQARLKDLKPEQDKKRKRLEDLSQLEINRRHGISKVSIDVQQLKQAIQTAEGADANKLLSEIDELRSMVAKLAAKPPNEPTVENGPPADKPLASKTIKYRGRPRMRPVRPAGGGLNIPEGTGIETSAIDQKQPAPQGSFSG
ncbi:MAG: hypothetical protein ABIH23_13165 [bacterium]